jgi:hypothetical protein
MTDKENQDLYGYWGKYHLFHHGDEPRKIWLGPMHYEEMIRYFPEFRHNFKEEKELGG